jgi:hypothetical protein
MVDRLIPDLTTTGIRGAGDSARRLIQEVNGWDVVYDFDDFTNDKSDAELQSRYPAVKTGVDGSIDTVASGISGEATIDVGAGAADDNEYGGWGLGELEYKGDLNAFCVARIKISNIATVKVEFGFTDSLADAGAVNSLAGNTFTADDAAMFVLDTDDTATWQAVGVKATTAATKNESGGIIAPVNAVYQTLGVFLEGDNARFVQWDTNGKKIGETISIDAAIEGGSAVAPWLFVQNRAAAQARNVTIDYRAVGQRRF